MKSASQSSAKLAKNKKTTKTTKNTKANTKALSKEEANKIVADFVDIREKYKDKSLRDKKIINDYNKLHKFCVEKFEYLVIMKTSKYRKFANYEDLKQDGKVALLLALDSFDKNKGDFFWWLHKYIDTRLSRSANSHSTIKIPIEKTKEIQPHKVSDLPVMIDQTDVFSEVSSIETKKRVQAAVYRLPEEQKKIVEMVYGLKDRPKSVSSVAKSTGMTVNECMKILGKAQKALRPQLEELVA